TIPRSHRADQTLVLKGLSGTEPSYVPSLRHPRNLSCSCFVPYTERLNNMGKQERKSRGRPQKTPNFYGHPGKAGGTLNSLKQTPIKLYHSRRRRSNLCVRQI